LCFPDHPYAWPVIGQSLEEVAGLTPETIRSFHKTYYRPDKARLVIVSCRPEAEVLELACRHFEHIKRRGSVSKKKHEWPSTYISPEKIKLKRKKVVRDVPDPVLYLCWHMPSVEFTINTMAHLLAELLSGSESSYLYARLVREKPLFTALQAFHLEGKLGGLFVISGRLKAHVSFSEAEENILKALEELAKEFLNKDRLERVKNMYRTAKAFELVQPSERAQRLLWYQLLFGNAAIEARDDEILESTRVEDLTYIINSFLDPEQRFVLEYETASRLRQSSP
jgi:predicted Zn-dependent peptidase